MSNQATGLLQVENLGIRFGGLQALQGVSFTIEPNQVMGLIGPNGAGKTTLFNLLTAVYTPTEGSISLNGENLAGKNTASIVKCGIARTFQNIRLFKDLSVIDNVKVAMFHDMSYGTLSALFRLPKYWKEEAVVEKRAHELLQVFDLDSLANTKAANLPYGKQRKLEIVRAMATNPKVLLLDEPAAGMNHTETHELMETIKFVKDNFGISILLIEHDMSLVMGICEKIVVLDYGKTIAEGTPDEIKQNEKVIGAYLGA